MSRKGHKNGIKLTRLKNQNVIIVSYFEKKRKLCQSCFSPMQRTWFCVVGIALCCVVLCSLVGLCSILLRATGRQW